MVNTRTPAMGQGGDDQTARQAAADAQATATNARGMANSLKDRVTALENAPAPTDPTVADRADLRQLVSALQQSLAGLQQAVAALPTRWPTIATGQAKTTALLALNASTDLVVPLTRAMPTTTYNVEPLSMTTGLVADSATIVVKAKAQTSVTLTVTAKVALLSGTGVSVLAWG